MSTLPGQHASRSHIRIDDLSFFGPGELEQVSWDSTHDLFAPNQSGTCEGKIMLQLTVDGSEMESSTPTSDPPTTWPPSEGPSTPWCTARVARQ
jgi:hypothetical protein